MTPKTITVTVTVETDDPTVLAQPVGRIVIRLRGEMEPEPRLIDYGWGTVQFGVGEGAVEAGANVESGPVTP